MNFDKIISFGYPQFTEDPSIYYTYLKNNWSKAVFSQQTKETIFEAFWNQTLHDGLVDFAKVATTPVTFAGDVNAAASKITGSHPNSGSNPNVATVACSFDSVFMYCKNDKDTNIFTINNNSIIDTDCFSIDIKTIHSKKGILYFNETKRF